MLAITRTRRALAAGLILSLAVCGTLGLIACDDGPAAEEQAPPYERDPNNVLVNGGFEEGEAPWFVLEGRSGFVLTSDAAHSGANSALLTMRDEPPAAGAKVYYLIQEVSPPELPEMLSGNYRVENWENGGGFQYLQFVVIVWGPKNFPPNSTNWQIRYPLAGIDSEPFQIFNAKFKFLTKDQPVEGEWVSFQTNLRQDFQDLWGMVPSDFEKIRILFEVRWDGRTTDDDGSAHADVYYDDLYAGPARSLTD